MGLDTGGDDYITNPFRLKRAVKPHQSPNSAPPPARMPSGLSVGDILIDTSQSKAMVATRDLPLTVTSTACCVTSAKTKIV